MKRLREAGSTATIHAGRIWRISSCVFLSIIFSSAWSQCPTPDHVFCSDFEESNVDNSWQHPNNSSSVPASRYLVSHAGPFGEANNHAIYIPPTGGGFYGGFFNGVELDVAYLRYYAMYEDGYDFGKAQHSNVGMFGGSGPCGSNRVPSGTNCFHARTEPMRSVFAFYTYYRGMYQDTAQMPDGGGDVIPCTMGSGYCKKPEHFALPDRYPPTMEAGKWYCVETMIDAGDAVANDAAANGRLDFWVDGKEYGPWPGFWFRTVSSLKLSGLWVHQYYHNRDGTKSIYYDNIAVSRTRIGCEWPEFTCADTGWVAPNTDYTYVASYSNPRNESVTFSVLVAPPWLTQTPGTNVFTGTSPATEGSHLIMANLVTSYRTVTKFILIVVKEGVETGAHPQRAREGFGFSTHMSSQSIQFDLQVDKQTPFSFTLSDVSGRRIWTFGPRIADTDRLTIVPHRKALASNGIYVAQLSQALRTVSRKVVLVR